MLVCEERHHSAVETAQDELASLAERLAHSPLVHAVTGTAERVAVDGLLSVGEDIVHGGYSLFNRWFSGGVETIVSDVTYVTNIDGRHNPDSGQSLDLPDMSSSVSLAAKTDTDEATNSDVVKEEAPAQALPNMPCCPITGEAMVDPVVAADGK
jgi:hypothetical protein